mmetsp:Transcript_41628/g.137141  ORF Transcript_41628/g.137141 Transcript_41628/m.137141 type:complete len:200 (-) Transcript_41628:162-761(-)
MKSSRVCWRPGPSGFSRNKYTRLLATMPLVGSYAAVRLQRHGAGQRLVAALPVAAGAAIFRFSGQIVGRNTGDRCLQVGQQSFLTPASQEGEPPWVFLQHSFRPSVRITHPPLAPRDPDPPVLTATAIEALPAGAPLTFDYTLHEYVMHGDGFVCEETGRQVRGFRFLERAEQEAALPRAMRHIRSQHSQFLFGQESRC